MMMRRRVDEEGAWRHVRREGYECGNRRQVRSRVSKWSYGRSTLYTTPHHIVSIYRGEHREREMLRWIKWVLCCFTCAGSFFALSSLLFRVVLCYIALRCAEFQRRDPLHTISLLFISFSLIPAETRMRGEVALSSSVLCIYTILYTLYICDISIKSKIKTDISGPKGPDTLTVMENITRKVGAKSCTRALHARRARHTHALGVCIRRAKSTTS